MNLSSIQTYTTPYYFNHINLMLYAIQQMGRRSQLSNIKINEAVITNVHDSHDDNQDQVSVAFDAQMHSVLLESATSTALQVDDSSFGEQWNFVRYGDTWLLNGIDQATEDKNQLAVDLKNFAQANGMYFSPDWGHSLIPTRGQLFSNGFTNTDINNYVIGFWQGNLLVQLYTYSPNTRSNSPTYYLIGQINLPKFYGGILILRRNRMLGNPKPRGYEKYELEWGEFNKRYDVLATDADKFTSFELLNPAFMAWMYDQNIEVNIEVVDNVVYLYSKVSAAENRYAEMLEILHRSYQELKM